jgi:hypothetical protein
LKAPLRELEAKTIRRKKRHAQRTRTRSRSLTGDGQSLPPIKPTMGYPPIPDFGPAAPASDQARHHAGDILRPMNQLNPESYLGKAFERVGRRRNAKGDPHESPSDTSSSESSQTDYEGGDSPHDTHDSDNTEMRKLRRRLRCKEEWYRQRRKAKRTLLKPIPPDPYDGTPDNRLFHRFVIQATNYIADGRVPQKRAYVLMNYLKDGAYEFYVQMVSYLPENWTLPEFFTELFNYCFPVNYRSEQRRKFKTCRQGNRKVREFVFELQELATVIGHVDEREMVNRLWFGCDKKIQAAMYLKELHPEMLTFQEVSTMAERIELSLAAAETVQGKGAGPSPPTTKPTDRPVHKRHRPQESHMRSSSVRHTGAEATSGNLQVTGGPVVRYNLCVQVTPGSQVAR